MQGVSAETGKRLSGADHLRQSVIDILTTPKRSRVLLRSYGSDLPNLLDNPLDESNRVRIIAATASALAQWEPRLKVTRITVNRQQEGAFELTVEGVNKESGIQLTLSGIQIYGNKS